MQGITMGVCPGPAILFVNNQPYSTAVRPNKKLRIAELVWFSVMSIQGT